MLGLLGAWRDVEVYMKMTVVNYQNKAKTDTPALAERHGT